MNQNLITAALAAVALSVSGAALAQSNAERAADPVHAGSAQSFTHGESKRCESMTGSAKEQCDKQEATKTDGEAQSPPATASGSSAPASSSAARAGDGSFTHGESQRCEKLTGAAKEQCDKEEA